MSDAQYIGIVRQVLVGSTMVICPRMYHYQAISHSPSLVSGYKALRYQDSSDTSRSAVHMFPRK